MITAEVELTIDSPQESTVIYRAIEPEVSSSVSEGVSISRRGNILSLNFRSRNTASMRASINSVLRWVRTSVSICKLVRRD